MGFRTVVMLNNDRTDEWSKDPLLGEKIQRAMYHTTRGEDRYGQFSSDLGYGRVVECTHADVQTLVKLEHYSSFEPVAHGHWYPDQKDAKMELLKKAAEDLGYRLVKKPAKKKKTQKTS